jgi:hypothetical protein
MSVSLCRLDIMYIDTSKNLGKKRGREGGESEQERRNL